MERLIPCTCGRNHLPESMIPDPDDPGHLLCPVENRDVMRLGEAERTVSNWLLLSAFGGDL